MLDQLILVIMLEEKDDLGDSDAVDRALQISANLLTTPDNDSPPLDIPYLSSVKYLENGKLPSIQSLAFMDPGQNDEKEELKKYFEFLRKKDKKYAEFIGKRMSWKPFQSDVGQKRGMEFIGKRNMEFLGKRNIIPVDKRYMEFLGKRAMEFLGKRTMEFLGKRYPSYRYGKLQQRRRGDWIG